VVDVSAALTEVPFPRVATDSKAITELAAEHLREQGFRHFAYCGDSRHLWSVRRSEFFQEQIRGFGGTCAHYTSRKWGNDRSAEDEIVSIARWLRNLPKPVGILACYDVRGQQVLEACKFAGLEVPDEVGVIRVHTDELLCEPCDPPLSSVVPNARRAGYEASELLARMMAGNKVPATIRRISPLGVVARPSTDVVTVNDPPVAAAVRYIREHALEGIGVQDVLRAVPMSRTLLERRFQRMLGQSPGAFISKVRIAHVKMLLATTGWPVGSIAERAGFEHTEYLSVAFRRETGMTPTKYRANHHVDWS